MGKKGKAVRVILRDLTLPPALDFLARVLVGLGRGHHPVPVAVSLRRGLEKVIGEDSMGHAHGAVVGGFDRARGGEDYGRLASGGRGVGRQELAEIVLRRRKSRIPGHVREILRGAVYGAPGAYEAAREAGIEYHDNVFCGEDREHRVEVGRGNAIGEGKLILGGIGDALVGDYVGDSIIVQGSVAGKVEEDRGARVDLGGEALEVGYHVDLARSLGRGAGSVPRAALHARDDSPSPILHECGHGSSVVV